MIMERILVVDDERDLLDILSFNLEAEGYAVTTAESAEEALTLPLQEYSLVLLDVMMGGLSGFDLARRMKQNALTARVPIIFLTALEGEAAAVKGLDLGADDFIQKPLSMRMVLARVRAVLRRTTAQTATDSDTLSCAGLVLDLDAKTCTVDGTAVALTKIEFEVLALLLRRAGTVLGRDELLRRCWPQDTYVLDRTVDVNITRLRKKLGAYGPRIKTRFGYGYSFER